MWSVTTFSDYEQDVMALKGGICRLRKESLASLHMQKCIPSELISKVEDVDIKVLT